MTTCTAKKDVTEEQFLVLLENVMDHFDFEKVHDVMVQIDWCWINAGNGELKVPTVLQLKQSARRYLRRAFDGCCTVGSGGLEAAYHPPIDTEDPAGFLTLRFILEEWDTEGCQVG
jgi:hypothetical protein